MGWADDTCLSPSLLGEGVGGGVLMGRLTNVKSGIFSARLSAQNLEKNTSKTIFLNIR